MSSLPSQSPPQRHTMKDWLALHGIDREDCTVLLADLARREPSAPSRCAKPDRTGETWEEEMMWPLAVAAVAELLPLHKATIENTFARSQKIVIPAERKTARAATIDHGPATYPTILYRLRGDASDVLMIAHEFGHALQIIASGGRFVTPVIRELCAFTAEIALLRYCKAHDPHRYGSLLENWQADSRRYFGKLATDFAAALADDENQYEYRWNYPLARLLSLDLANCQSEEMVWNVFCGELTVREIIGWV